MCRRQYVLEGMLEHPYPFALIHETAGFGGAWWQFLASEGLPGAPGQALFQGIVAFPADVLQRQAIPIAHWRMTYRPIPLVIVPGHADRQMLHRSASLSVLANS